MGFFKVVSVLPRVVWRSLNVFPALQGKKILNGVRSPDQFWDILNRERCRSDRSGREFSVVMFDVAGSYAGDRKTILLAEILSERLRSTDEVGWYEGKMSLLLPDTAAQGAWTLVEDVRKKAGEIGPSIECIIYNYPFRESNAEDKGKGKAQVQQPVHRRVVDLARK